MVIGKTLRYIISIFLLMPSSIYSMGVLEGIGRLGGNIADDLNRNQGRMAENKSRIDDLQEDILHNKQEIAKLQNKLDQNPSWQEQDQLNRKIDALKNDIEWKRREMRSCKSDLSKDQVGDEFLRGAARIYTDGLNEGKKALFDDLASQRKIQEAQALGEVESMKEAAKMYAMMKQLLDPKNLKNVAFAVTGAAAGVSAVYYMAKFGYSYALQMLGKPTLIRDTSIKSLSQKMVDYVLERKPEKSRIDELVLEPKLEQSIKEITETCELGIKEGDGVRHVLLTGPAGTGKTMFAKALAARLNQKKLKDKKGNIIPVNYACCAGADFAQFKNGEDIIEINKIVDYAKSADGITILFVDEIDSLLKNRLDPLATQATIDRTNKMLDIFDKPTHKKIMLIGATNFEHKIDRAAFTRFSKKVGFTLPHGDILEKLFDQYMNKEVFNKKIKPSSCFTEHQKELALSMEGLSARGVEDVCSQIYSRCRFLQSTEATYEIAQSIIQDQLEADKRNKGEIIVKV